MGLFGSFGSSSASGLGSLIGSLSHRHGDTYRSREKKDSGVKTTQTKSLPLIIDPLSRPLTKEEYAARQKTEAEEYAARVKAADEQAEKTTKSFDEANPVENISGMLNKLSWRRTRNNAQKEASDDILKASPKPHSPS